MIGYILTQPIHEIHFFFEEFIVLLWQVSMRYGTSPFVRTAVSNGFSRYDIKEGRYGKRVAAQQCDLISFIYGERDIAEQYPSIHRLLQFFYIQYLVPYFS